MAQQGNEEIVLDIPLQPPHTCYMVSEEKAEFMTRAEAAELLRVSTRTLKRWHATGVLRAFKLGKLVRYNRTALLRRLGA